MGLTLKCHRSRADESDYHDRSNNEIQQATAGTRSGKPWARFRIHIV